MSAASRCFSALQRAENSSMVTLGDKLSDVIQRFSALQRAENSSMIRRSALGLAPARFSALQRAENSSMSLQRAARY